MIILLRLAAIVELAIAVLWAIIATVPGRDCTPLLSHAPSFNACMSAAPSAYTFALAGAVLFGATLVALALFALAGLIRRADEIQRLLSATRLDQSPSK